MISRISIFDEEIKDDLEQWNNDDLENWLKHNFSISFKRESVPNLDCGEQFTYKTSEWEITVQLGRFSVKEHNRYIGTGCFRKKDFFVEGTPNKTVKEAEINLNRYIQNVKEKMWRYGDEYTKRP